LPTQTRTPRPSLTDCDHPNATHFAIEKYVCFFVCFVVCLFVGINPDKHEERLTVGAKKICVKSEFRSANSKKSNPAAKFAENLQGFGSRSLKKDPMPRH